MAVEPYRRIPVSNYFVAASAVSTAGRHVGRVGALAVALGIGVAVATGGIGPAWAGNGPTDNSQNSGTPQAGDADASSQPGTKSESSPPSSTEQLTADDSGVVDNNGSGQGTASGHATGSAPAMNYGNSGSVDTSVNDIGQSTDSIVGDDELSDDQDDVEDDVEGDDLELAVGEGSATEPETAGNQQDSALDTMSEIEPPTAGSDSSWTPDAFASKLVVDYTVPDEPDFDGDGDVEETPASPLASRVNLVLDDIGRGGALVQSRMSADDQAIAAQSSMGIPTTFTGVAGAVVAAMLAPFLAPGPVAPAEPPLLWALLAWTRREIQRTFFNQTPEAVVDTATTSEDAGVTIDVVSGTDPEADAGDVVTVTSVTQPQNGVVTVDGGTLTYAPKTDFHGTDTFTYTISDAGSGWHLHGWRGLLAAVFGGDALHTDTVTVTVTVGAVNDGPVAVDDTVTVEAGSGPTVIDVLDNDTDPDGDVLTILGVQAAENGVVALENGVLTYAPNAGFTGTDSFSYTVADANDATATATVTVMVEANFNVITFEDGGIPTEVITTDDPTRIFVRTGSQLRIVDPTTGEWLDTVGLGAIPFSFAMSPDRRYAYVGTYSSGTDFVPVGRIDVETGTSTPIGGVRQPTAMAISADGGTLYVTNNQDGTVSVIDTDTGDFTIINTGLQSSAIALSEDGTTLYVGSIINDVRVVNIATGNYTVLPTGTYDGMNVADQSITVVGNRAYVTDGLNNKLAVIDTDTNTIIGTYDVGARPASAAALPGGELVFVANRVGDSITVIAPESGGVIGELEVGNNPTDIDVADGFVYVTTSGGIAVIPVEQIGELLEVSEVEA
ncbi:Ig-like domain-containing protein [Mycolicibacterium gadium]|uniref:Ig-like domain-containing protein n=1 Tax=Mycolicibacterium gadium TaxID=1794 RepID=UPI002FDCDE7D